MSDLLTEAQREVLYERLDDLNKQLRASRDEVASDRLRTCRLGVLTRLLTDDAKMLRDLLLRAGRRGGVKKIKGWSQSWRARATVWANARISGEAASPPAWVAALPEVRP